MRANLLVTFVLGGLWHGAGWTFVLWGTFHGVYLSMERLARRMCGLPEKPPDRTPRALALLGRFWIFLVVCFSWILFRSPNLEGVREILSGLTRWGESVRLFSGTALAVLAAGFLMQFMDGTRPRRIWDTVNRWPLWVQAGAAALLLTAILGIGPTGVAPFIYFQF
jgi:D-alanyl-lipoteichoic acid acyltransferase DltB (MBOAT superfamily)